MSKLWKGVKKVFKKVVKPVTKLVKKVMENKYLRVVAIAGLTYFGGAAISSMMGGGTFASGVSSAWTGLTNAGSSFMAGNFSQGFGALASGASGGTSTAFDLAGNALTSEAGKQIGTEVVKNAVVDQAKNQVVKEAGKSAFMEFANTAAGQAATQTALKMGAGYLDAKAAEEEEEKRKKERTWYGKNGYGEGNLSGMNYSLDIQPLVPRPSVKKG